MIKAPKTKGQAAAHRYGVKSANPAGSRYDPERCAYEVWPRYEWGCRQCGFKNGKGVNGLYCRVHAKKVRESNYG